MCVYIKQWSTYTTADQCFKKRVYYMNKNNLNMYFKVQNLRVNTKLTNDIRSTRVGENLF